MDEYFFQYHLALKSIFLHLGDYRECLLVVWNTLNYTVLTSTTTTVPMHDVNWDPSTVNEFVSVGTAGMHNTLCESTSLVAARKRSLRRLCFYTCLSFCSQGGRCLGPHPRGEG